MYIFFTYSEYDFMFEEIIHFSKKAKETKEDYDYF